MESIVPRPHRLVRFACSAGETKRDSIARLGAQGQSLESWRIDQAALNSTVPFIPTAMSGWDPRPWNEREFITGDLMWYSRSPQEVGKLRQRCY